MKFSIIVLYGSFCSTLLFHIGVIATLVFVTYFIGFVIYFIGDFLIQ